MITCLFLSILNNCKSIKKLFNKSMFKVDGKSEGKDKVKRSIKIKLYATL